MLLVKVVDDVNNNGIIDIGDSIVTIDSIRKAFNQNETLARTIQFMIQGNTVCRLFLVVDSNECVCSPSIIKVPALGVLNAGRDTLACSGANIDIGLASKGIHTYRWFPDFGFSNPDSSWTIMNYNNLETTSNLQWSHLLIYKAKKDQTAYLLEKGNK